MRKTEVVPHNPGWYQEFELESKQVAIALGSNVVKIHHIGSTSISSIYAKPIIDMLVEVKDISAVDKYNAHPEEAKKYSELKQELAKKFPNDINSYMDGKHEFVEEMEIKANNCKQLLG